MHLPGAQPKSRLRSIDRDCYSVLYPLHPRAAKPAAWIGSEVIGGSELLKAAFDKAVALLIVIVLAPLLLVIAIAIKCDTRGPVLFRQLRVGHRGQLFAILKFRTMRHSESDLVAARQTQPGDGRVTLVGAFLRKYSLDELPQLFNVLAGDMSLVGPRPLAPGTSIGGVTVDTLFSGFSRRHIVKPGMTGLAQARGLRGALVTPCQLSDRIEADIEYVRRRSFWLDLKIMVATVVRELRRPQGV